jgi:hypothetical protein
MYCYNCSILLLLFISYYSLIYKLNFVINMYAKDVLDGFWLAWPWVTYVTAFICLMTASGLAHMSDVWCCMKGGPFCFCT